MASNNNLEEDTPPPLAPLPANLGGIDLTIIPDAETWMALVDFAERDKAIIERGFNKVYITQQVGDDIFKCIAAKAGHEDPRVKKVSC